MGLLRPYHLACGTGPCCTCSAARLGTRGGEGSGGAPLVLPGALGSPGYPPIRSKYRAAARYLGSIDLPRPIPGMDWVFWFSPFFFRWGSLLLLHSACALKKSFRFFCRCDRKFTQISPHSGNGHLQGQLRPSLVGDPLLLLLSCYRQEVTELLKLD